MDIFYTLPVFFSPHNPKLQRINHYIILWLEQRVFLIRSYLQEHLIF